MDRERVKEIKYQILLSTCPETGVPYTVEERRKIGIEIDFTVPELLELIKEHSKDSIIVLWIEFIKEIWKLNPSSSC